MDLPKDILLEVMNFLPVEDLDLFSPSLNLIHRRLRTAVSVIQAKSDLVRARNYPQAGYVLFVYDVDLYSDLEDYEFPRVLKLYTSIYIPPFFQNLQYLNVSHTVMRRLPDYLTSLTSLNCSHTPLRFLPTTYTKLKQLDVTNCSIHSVPEEYTKLEVLDVYGSGVRELSSQFRELRRLNVGRTEIDTIPYTYEKLVRLNCKLSNVREIPESLTSLRWLDCSYTNVTVPEKIREKLEIFIYR